MSLVCEGILGVFFLVFFFSVFRLETCSLEWLAEVLLRLCVVCRVGVVWFVLCRVGVGLLCFSKCYFWFSLVSFEEKE